MESYAFSVSYEAINVIVIEDIHKYLMKKHNIVCLDSLSKHSLF